MTVSLNRIKCSDRFARIAVRAGYLWLFCLCVTIVPVFADSLAARGLVYCPLQKAWVKEAGEAPIPDALRNVCASDAAKEKFYYESFRRLRLTRNTLNERETEELFFDHSKIGERAFERIKPVQTPDRPGITDGTASEPSIISARPIIAKALTPIVPTSPLVRAHEPCRLPGTRNDISRKSVFVREAPPRAPPVSP